ncbi:LLM class flavin-dependent oxidoreductase [Acidocella aminolytica]|jgi:alkanesulfonate monooxygenase SsuD/methylene tetrahydromethanopterin reductase-like flavin-dependent oxidoreductase (luciferase family)|uniref:Luciferase-like monooxygenase n=1 Tax=Acidocella aminolytica 101 = DSM 11237 TaxID=1120923 RepID=A0A0D6PEZ2_9PROT|nr:LLM class flavin-dependent oxidoreductase [Acidocella aminolytica]GAN79429.1 luciferase-like monooxygenase [Acidocella aminolytica 101 = DSM 11237]GBQ43913.1 coenzyme F420-dependent N5,N10-methylene tetrahydromethanopterin reductase [Acidocella aminolytica 101 = DSM 11237]SHE45692.1 Flavin-dependent oxidoreductase, luciferase family (includes alkanesulfonate monooxygenase SsuD and methylene tetrahydromethanopterin reductase) [Acidocella aminolytica 101 = DSM 11237]
MKFSLFVHMERLEAGQSHTELLNELEALVKLAEEGGMQAAWIGEHHGMEFTIAPNPFIQIAYLAPKTTKIRLGTSSVIAPFWHPIKLAGETAMTDVITGGRLELGIARGAYSYEYERLHPGLTPMEAGLRMRELVPAVQKLLQGDYEHQGEYWQFPKTSAVPQPVQPGGPPMWVAARDPNSHEFAVRTGCNVQVTPLASGDVEVESLMQRFNAACEANPEVKRPQIMLLQHTYVASDEPDAARGAEELSRFYCYFGAWFLNKRPVTRGAMERMTPEEMAAMPQFSPEAVRKNLVIGTADEVVARLKSYEALGYDQFSMWIDSGMSFARKKASLLRFIKEVMPHFQEVHEYA